MKGIYLIRVSFFCCRLWNLYIFDKQKTPILSISSASNNWILLGDYGYGVNLDSKKRRKKRERRRRRKKEKKKKSPTVRPGEPATDVSEVDQEAVYFELKFAKTPEENRLGLLPRVEKLVSYRMPLESTKP